MRRFGSVYPALIRVISLSRPYFVGRVALLVHRLTGERLQGSAVSVHQALPWLPVQETGFDNIPSHVVAAISSKLEKP